MSNDLFVPFLIAVPLFSVLLLLSLRRIRYGIIYNIILLTTASIPILLLIIDNWVRQEKFSKTFLLSVIIFVLLFVPVLFILSIYNLFKKKGIHWVISAIGILLSIAFLGIAGMIEKMSRVGIIG